MSRLSTSSPGQQSGHGQVGQAPQSVPQIPHEKIAMRAYEKWCQRGRTHGHDLQDWLEAEQELRNEALRSMGATPRR
jgi:hypothetical protein